MDSSKNPETEYKTEMTIPQMLHTAMLLRGNFKKLKRLNKTLYNAINPIQLTKTLVSLSIFLAQNEAQTFTNPLQNKALFVIEQSLICLLEDIQKINEISNAKTSGEIATATLTYTNDILIHINALTYCTLAFPDPTDLVDPTIDLAAMKYAARKAASDVKQTFKAIFEKIKSSANRAMFGIDFYRFVKSLKNEIEKNKQLSNDDKKIAIERLKNIILHVGTHFNRVNDDQISDLSSFMVDYKDKIEPSSKDKFEDLMTRAPEDLLSFYQTDEDYILEDNEINNSIDQHISRKMEEEIKVERKIIESKEKEKKGLEQNIKDLEKEEKKLQTELEKEQTNLKLFDEINKLQDFLSQIDKYPNKKELEIGIKSFSTYKENIFINLYGKLKNIFTRPTLNEQKQILKSKIEKKIKKREKRIKETNKEVKKEAIETKIESLTVKLKEMKEKKSVLQDKIIQIKAVIEGFKEKISRIEGMKPKHWEVAVASLRQKKESLRTKIKQSFEDTKLFELTHSKEDDLNFVQLPKTEEEITLPEKIKAHVPEQFLEIFQLEQLMKDLVESYKKSSTNTTISKDLEEKIRLLSQLTQPFLDKSFNDPADIQKAKAAFFQQFAHCYSKTLRNSDLKSFKDKFQVIDNKVWRFINKENSSANHGALYLMRKARAYLPKHRRVALAFMIASEKLCQKMENIQKFGLTNEIKQEDINAIIDKAITEANNRVQHKDAIHTIFSSLTNSDKSLREKLDKRLKTAIGIEYDGGRIDKIPSHELKIPLP